MTAQDIGLPGAPIRVSSDPPIGGGTPPRRLDVELDLPAVSGAGTLLARGDGEYAGVLAVRMDPLSVSAFGLLALPAGTRPLSFVVVLGATFPPPGIQVGFGFAVTGVGGVVAVNRRVDRDALLRSILDGSAGRLLFPADPVADGPAVLPVLESLFPVAPGYVVAGPLLQLSWGGELVTASVAVLTEVGSQVRLAMVGTLRVAIPHPAAPLIELRATFLAEVDPAEPRVAFVAALTGSRLAGIPISGDLVLLTRGGRDATFVLSAGGFHPRYAVPRGVPPVRRIAMPLSPPPIELRAEAYLAVTSNSVQFGARLDLRAQVAGCGLRGHLELDVLIQWRPELFFVADLSAGIAVTVAGRSLVGVQLQLTLSGPTPWRARGRGSVDLFFFDVSFDFDLQWGSAPPLPPAPVDIGAELRRALGPSSPEAWVVRGAVGAGVRLSAAATRALRQAAVVHPAATLAVRQARVPLGVRIERFGRTPVPAQTWDIAAARLGGVPAELGRERREEFAPGEFLALSDDQQLSRPGFEPLRAGYELMGGPVVVAPARPTDLDHHTVVIGGTPPPAAVGRFRLDAVEAVLAASTAADPAWWRAPADVITVADEAPAVLASTWDLTQPVEVGTGLTVTELHEVRPHLAHPALAVVERWELG